jgi:membrane protease YdiL (CAAX protease family)
VTENAPERSGRPLEGSEPLQSGDPLAAQLRGFGPRGVAAILLILASNAVAAPLSAALALAWAWRSGTPWREIGYVQPVRWIRVVMVGIVFGIAFKLVLKAIVMPLLGAPPVNQPYHYLVGNREAIPATLFTLMVGAGWGEETVYRGYLFERLGKLVGTGVRGKILVVLVTALVFSLAHYSVQGLAGAEQAAITGLVFGTIFAITGRIWLLMVSHAAFDLTAYAMIYWNLESNVARLLFK